MIETKYWYECDVCDNSGELTPSEDVVEEPEFCPMCGSPANFEEIDE